MTDWCTDPDHTPEPPHTHGDCTKCGAEGTSTFTQEVYGYSQDCTACGDHFYFSIGD